MAASSLSKKFIYISYFLIFLVLALFFVPTNARGMSVKGLGMSVKGLDAGLVIDGAKVFVETLRMVFDRFLPKDKKE